MKKLVWSETLVEGGRAFAGRLAPPPAVAGPFQDIPGGKASPFYRDVATLAYRLPADAVPVRGTAGDEQRRYARRRAARRGATRSRTRRRPAASGGRQHTVDPVRLSGTTDVRSLVVTLADAGRFDLRSRSARSRRATMARPSAGSPISRFGSFRQTTSAFAPVTARAFRIDFKRPADNGPVLATDHQFARARYRRAPLRPGAAPAGSAHPAACPFRGYPGQPVRGEGGLRRRGGLLCACRRCRGTGIDRAGGRGAAT